MDVFKTPGRQMGNEAPSPADGNKAGTGQAGAAGNCGRHTVPGVTSNAKLTGSAASCAVRVDGWVSHAPDEGMAKRQRKRT